MSHLTGRKTINLTAKEKKGIEKILKSKQPVLRVYKRAKVLYLVSSGYTQAKAALQAAGWSLRVHKQKNLRKI